MQVVFLLSALSFNSESSQDIQERMAIAFPRPLLKDIQKGRIEGNSICDMNHKVTGSFTSSLRLPLCDADFTDPFSYYFILIHAHRKMNIFQVQVGQGICLNLCDNELPLRKMWVICVSISYLSSSSKDFFHLMYNFLQLSPLIRSF